MLPHVQSIHKKMGPGSGELPYLAVFRDFVVHSAVLQNLKFEKWSKRVPELGFEPHSALLQVGSNGLDFVGFSQFSAFGAKPGRNPILARTCVLEKKTTETQLEEDSIGDCRKFSKKIKV